MKQVRYTGQNPTLHKGQTALMNDDGKVQLDGPKEGWRASERMDPRCFGWHDLGQMDVEWEEIVL